jgi:diphosphomevalonate decarboxylase
VNTYSVTAKAHPNIAFIKYWGNQDDSLRLPSNGSISMNLASLNTTTTAIINPKLTSDRLELNGSTQAGPSLHRIQQYLGFIRKIYKRDGFLEIKSANDFPMSAGIASSASAFAALSTVVAHLYGLHLQQKELSAIARLGSGSACRSIPSGYCEWKTGSSHEESFAITIAPEHHWRLWDCIAVVESKPKEVSSTKGHSKAYSSPLQHARIMDAPRRLDICRNAIIKKDFGALSEIIELDSNLMHAVMMTSKPPIIYWQPTSLLIMQEVKKMRQKGIAAAYTLDAGSNVHVICTEESYKNAEEILQDIPGVVEILKSPSGSGASLFQSTSTN